MSVHKIGAGPAQPMSKGLRALLEARQDQTYQQGFADGIEHVAKHALRRESITFALGMAAAVALRAAWLWISH